MIQSRFYWALATLIGAVLVVVGWVVWVKVSMREAKLVYKKLKSY